jgi:hypothetical protein
MDMLEDFLSDPPAGVKPDQLDKARWLLIGVRSALLDQYEGIVAAQRRAKDEASARAREAALRQAEHKKMLAEADRLAKEGEAGMNARLLAEAARLRSRVASGRALDAFQSAMDLYAEGNYLKAGRVLDRLRQWTQMQRAVDPRFRPGIGADREKRVTACLARLDDVKANWAAAEALAKVHAAVVPIEPGGGVGQKEAVASIR